MYMYLYCIALGLTSLTGVKSQVTTAFLFPVVGGQVSLEGQIIGTGSDGTTYVLSGSPPPGSQGLPVTVTLVEDATHVSELAIVSGESATVSFNAQCSVNGQSLAVCVVESGVATSGSTTLGTFTGTASFEPVPIIVSTSGAAAPSTTSSGSQTQVTITTLSSPTTATATQSTSGSVAYYTGMHLYIISFCTFVTMLLGTIIV